MFFNTRSLLKLAFTLSLWKRVLLTCSLGALVIILAQILGLSDEPQLLWN
jgi:hypothetical protein